MQSQKRKGDRHNNTKAKMPRLHPGFSYSLDICRPSNDSVLLSKVASKSLLQKHSLKLQVSVSFIQRDRYHIPAPYLQNKTKQNPSWGHEAYGDAVGQVFFRVVLPLSHAGEHSCQQGVHLNHINVSPGWTPGKNSKCFSFVCFKYLRDEGFLTRCVKRMCVGPKDIT